MVDQMILRRDNSTSDVPTSHIVGSIDQCMEQAINKNLSTPLSYTRINADDEWQSFMGILR